MGTVSQGIISVYADNLGKFNYLPEYYPAIRYAKYTQEDLDNMVANYHLQRVEASKHWAMKYDIVGYMEVCTRMKLNLTEWIGMAHDPFVQRFGYPDEIKEALKREAQQLNERIRKEREEELSKLRMEQDTSQANRSFENLRQSNPLDRVLK